MIAFRDDLPLIQLADGAAVSFDREWLAGSLVRAAGKAGYAQWWLAEHVAESVTHYLRTQQEVTVLPVESLGRAVQAALEVIGYADVARHFEPGRPRLRVSLLEMARDAGDTYELGFFELLGRRIWELLHEQHLDFDLTDLEPSVKLLRNRKVWSRDCARLQAEIVTFARQHAMQATEGRETAFGLR